MQLRLGNRIVGYDSLGSGETLVLVHAFPFDRRMWRDQALSLSTERRIVTIDLPGFGESHPLEEVPTVDTFADQIVALLDHLGIEKAAVGGLSMGGYVALAFAANHAHRLQGLVLCDTRAAADSAETKAARGLAINLVKEQGVPEYLERQLAKLLSPKATHEVRTEVRRLGNQSVEGVIAGLQVLRDRPDRTKLLTQITCPTLLIVGEEDAISFPEEMAAMAAAIPGSRLIRIPGAGHLANLENPEAFAEALGTL
jgi:3-oxoadipate enol-lactonase